MTVPARRRKIFERSTSLNPSELTVGHRYGGISSTNGVLPLLSTVDFRRRAVTTAATKPRIYSPSMAAACAPRNGQRIGRLGMKAAMIRVKTGSRAEHVINGAIKIVAIRSRLLSIVRVAMIAGTAQAYAESKGIKDFPCSPNLDIVRSAIRAARPR